MAALMDLIAGDSREILLVISIEDWPALDDAERFGGHLSLGGGLDPTWLDLFAEAVRGVTGEVEPGAFLDARRELDGPGDVGERTVERVDAAWVSALARVGDPQLDAVAGRWIDLIEEELGELPREEKPWIRTLTRDVIEFARAAEASPDVIFAWSM
jgi:hypothetical protein